MRQCQRLISLLIPSTLSSFSTSPFSSSPPTHLCTSDINSYAGWAESKEEAEAEFYGAADWGYLDALRAGSSSLCTRTPKEKEGSSSSSVFCAPNLQACKASNIMLDFSGLESRVRKENLRYSTDIFRPGQLVVSGCDLDTSFLDHATASFPLQSWGPELRHLVESEEGMQCDDTIDTPTLMVKLDATSNMYHHFCDFFNIFISLNLNGSIVPEAAGRQILILDNHPYHSSFRPAWKSVTDRHLWDLNSVAGKRICFTDLLMPLLPRMVYGLYYGTPLIPGCHSSSMFSAFSTWFSSALGLPSPSTQLPLRLTLLSRATKYRQILNEQEIVEALSAKGYQVTVAKFTPLVPFQEQLETIRNTDILVGIHGAGLTHLLFLPDWAHVVELYNCDDPGCYKDLARLRGVGYSTWTAEDLLTQVPGDQADPNARGPAHKKFANYIFDVEEILRIVGEAEEKVSADKKLMYRRTNGDEL